jgi:hypothetical protein
MTNELKAALERLSELFGELEGNGGNDKVTARTLKEKIEAQAKTVSRAYRASLAA